MNEHLEVTFKKPLKNGATRFVTVRDPPELAIELASQEVVFSGKRTRLFWSSAMISLLPFAVPLLIWMVMIRGVCRKAALVGKLMAIGKSKAKVYIENAVKTSFFDVAGVEEAKQSYEKSWSF